MAHLFIILTLLLLGFRNWENQLNPITEGTLFQPTLGFKDLALLNPERALSNVCKGVSCLLYVLILG